MNVGIKFLVVLLAVGFLFLLIHSVYAENVGEELKRGFADVDASRIYTSVNGLLGESAAVTRLGLRNSYAAIKVQSGGTLLMEAPFMDKSKTVKLPPAFSYKESTLEGGTVCVAKEGGKVTLKTPPCEV